MVAGGEAGNDVQVRGEEIYDRNGWKVDILPKGWQEGHQRMALVTLTGRRERELPLKYFHQKATRFFSGLSSNSSHPSLIHRQTSQIH